MALLDHQLFVKTGTSVPELSLFPTSLALLSEVGWEPHCWEHMLLSPTPFYSLTSFLVTGNPTRRGTFFFLLSKSPWPLHHLNKHSKFHCEFRLREAKYRSRLTWLLLHFLPWHIPPLRHKRSAGYLPELEENTWGNTKRNKSITWNMQP